MARSKKTGDTDRGAAPGTQAKRAKPHYPPRPWGPTPEYEPRLASATTRSAERAGDAALGEGRDVPSTAPLNELPRKADLAAERLKPIVPDSELRDGMVAALELLAVLHAALRDEHARGAPLDHERAFVAAAVEAADRYRTRRAKLRADAKNLFAHDELSKTYGTLAAAWERGALGDRDELRFDSKRVRTAAQQAAIASLKSELGRFVGERLGHLGLSLAERADAEAKLLVDGDYVHAAGGPVEAAAKSLEQIDQMPSWSKLKKMRSQIHATAARAAQAAKLVPSEIREALHAPPSRDDDDEAVIDEIEDAGRSMGEFVRWIVNASSVGWRTRFRTS